MATIYAYSSNSIYCTYSLSMTRSGSNVTVRAWGTIYGNGSSADSSGNNLYAHVCYNVSPANTGTATTYVSSYGTMVGTGKQVVGSPLNKSSIPTGGKAFDVSWTWANNAAISYSNCALFFSKSASSPSSFGSGSGGQAYSFIGKKSSDLSAAKLRYYTQSLSVAAGYTNVGNPTSVTVSPAIVKPGGTVTVSWSGATNGTNNAVASYAVTFNGTTKNVTGSSTTFTAPSSRGSSYSASVKSNPTISGYGPSSGKASSNSTKINTLPGAPTISISPTNGVVPSTGGTVRFTLSALGSNSDSGQTITCWYANNTSKTGEKQLTSYVDLTMNSSQKTIYFWCWDGLEYSSTYTAKTITINTKPTATAGAMALGGATYYSAKLNGNYQAPNVISCDGSYTDTTTGTVKYEWDLCYTANSTTFNSSSYTVAATNISTVKAPTGLDFRSYLPFNCAYKLRFYVHDGYEWSAASFTTNQGVIPPAPTFESEIYNQSYQTDVTGSAHNHFHDILVAGFTQDTGVSIKSVTLNSTVVSNRSLNADCNVLTVDELSSISQARQTGYSLSIVLNSAATTKETISKTYTDLIRDGAPYGDLSEVTISPALTKPYSAVSTDDIKIHIPSFGSDYNVITGTGQNINVFVYLTNGEYTLPLNGTWSWETEPGGDIKLTIPQNFYNLSNNDLHINLETKNNLGLKMEFINVFTDNKYELAEPNRFVMDCVEPFLDSSQLLMEINGTSPTDNSIIYENDILTYKFDWKAYNAKQVQIETYIYRSTTITTNLDNLPESSWIKYPNENDYKTTFYTALTSSAAIKQGTESINIKIGVVNESKYIYFKIKAGFVDETIEDYFYVEGMPPSPRSQKLLNIKPLSIKKAEYQTGQLSWNHNIYDTGGGLINSTVEGISPTVGGITSCKFQFQVSPINVDFTANSLYILNDGSLGYKYIIQTNSQYPEGWETPQIYTKYYTYDIDADVFNQVTEPTAWEADKFYLKNTLDSSQTGGIKTITITGAQNLTTEEQKDQSQTPISFLQSSWNIDNTAYQYLNIRLVAIVDSGSINKITYGEIYLIFDFGPTVSYRKNQVGINVKPEDKEDHKDDGVVFINMANTNQKYVILYGIVNGVETIHTIDIATGELNGFIINGGNWSNPNDPYDILDLSFATGNTF